MYRLHYYPGTAGLAVHMMLEEIGAAHELALVDLRNGAQTKPDYLRLNPNARVPTLEDDGQVIYEAAAICLHLADRHPEAGLAPAIGTAERGQFYKWLVYMTNTVQTDLMTYFMPGRLIDDEAGQAAVRAAAERRVETRFDLLDAALGEGPWLLGKRFSACDFYLLMLGRWTRAMERPARTLPRMGPYLARVADRPAAARAFAAEGIGAPLF